MDAELGDDGATMKTTKRSTVVAHAKAAVERMQRALTVASACIEVDDPEFIAIRNQLIALRRVTARLEKKP